MWRRKMIVYMEHVYGCHVSEFEGYDDDRMVYINTYNMIMNALDSIPDEVNLYVRTALRKAIHEDLEMLNRIIARFCDDEH